MKQGSRKDGAITLASVEKGRRRNMRQLLLRASRIVNRHVVEGLHARGYTDLRSTHTTLLSNIELENAGYIRVKGDPKDARARVLQLTKTGRQLMLDSLEVMAELEHRYARSVGRDQLAAVLGGLAAFLEAAEQD
jgi:hypothetical protein